MVGVAILHRPRQSARDRPATDAWARVTRARDLEHLHNGTEAKLVVDGVVKIRLVRIAGDVIFKLCLKIWRSPVPFLLQGERR